MSKKKNSKNWLAKRDKEYFFKQSKIYGYRSRSSFKLIEINKKFKFLRKNLLLLDLGSSPGGWTQVAKKEIVKGEILAIDIKDMEKIDGVDFIRGDFRENEICKKIITYFSNKVDVVLSDMAANTSGNKSLDSYRTGELCMDAMNLSKKILANDGVFLSKIFMGSIFRDINERAKNSFKKVLIYKPLSSRKESKEIYIFCKGIKKM